MSPDGSRLTSYINYFFNVTAVALIFEVGNFTEYPIFLKNHFPAAALK
jgi:hypothetical protein